MSQAWWGMFCVAYLLPSLGTAALGSGSCDLGSVINLSRHKEVMRSRRGPCSALTSSMALDKEGSN